MQEASASKSRSALKETNGQDVQLFIWDTVKIKGTGENDIQYRVGPLDLTPEEERNKARPKLLLAWL